MNPKNTLISAVITSFSLICAPPALASGDDHAPKFGGIVAEGKAFDAELIAKPELITVHVRDHGKPMPTQGARGKITMLTGANKTVTELSPAGDSRMEAKGQFNVSMGTKAVVEITLQGKKPSTLRFVIK